MDWIPLLKSFSFEFCCKPFFPLLGLFVVSGPLNYREWFTLYNHPVLIAFWGGDSDKQPDLICTLNWLLGQTVMPSRWKIQLHSPANIPVRLAPETALFVSLQSLLCGMLYFYTAEERLLVTAAPGEAASLSTTYTSSAVSPALLSCCFS